MTTSIFNIGTSCNWDQAGQNQCIMQTTTAGRVIATTAALPTYTYGKLLWPHTLIASAVGILTVDGVATVINDIIIVKNEVTTANNGIYYVSTAGTAGVSYILTRVNSWNPPIMPGTFAVCDSGTTNIRLAFATTTRINEVGVDSCTFAQNTNIAPVAVLRANYPLPGTPTYAANTITATVNGIFAVDGTNATATTQKVLVLGQTNPINNGLYDITTVGTAGTTYQLTRTSGYASGNSVTAGRIFTVNGFAGTAGTFFNSVVVLSATVTVNTDPWVCYDAPGACSFMQSGAATVLGLNIVDIATMTIDSDLPWGPAAKPLGAVTARIATGAAAANSIVIDASKTWWAPYRSGTGTAPAPTYNVVDVTRSAVGIGRFLGIWENLGQPPIASGVSLPTSGFVKFRQLETAVTLVDGDTLTFTGGATVVVDGAGQYGWLYVPGSGVTGLTIYGNHTFTTTGQWFYLDSANGTPGQHVVCPVAGQYPAVQVETGNGTGIYEWWTSAGWFQGTLSTVPTLKWGGLCGVQSDVRGKVYGCSSDGVLEFGPRGFNQQSLPTCVAIATAALPNTATYATATQRWTAGANAALVVDGVTVNAGDYVLVTPSAALSNGIFQCIVAGSVSVPWVLKRPFGFDVDKYVLEGMRPCYVSGGTVNNAKRYYCQYNTQLVDTTTDTFVEDRSFCEMPNCDLATTSATSLSSGTFAYDTLTEILTCTSGFTVLTVDGVSATVGMSILVKDQATSSQNGIYQVLSVGSGSVTWKLQREYHFSKRFNPRNAYLGAKTLIPIRKNSWVCVLQGTVNARKCFVLQDAVADVGSSSVTWLASGNAWDFAACVVCSYSPLPNFPTYDNTGQTLTANNNDEPYSQLIVDGYTVTTGDRILVIGQATRFQNGIYSVTTQGDTSTAWVLTRVTGFNTAAQPVYYNQCVWVTGGNRYRCTNWTLLYTVTTFGTTSVIFGQGEPNTEWVKCRIATIGVLPNTPTAATNTLTSTGATTLTIAYSGGNYVVALNDIILVKDQAAAAQNGIYYCSNAGGASSWVLTRLPLGWDSTAAGLAPYSCIGAYTGGYIGSDGNDTNNLDTYWYLTSPIVTVGTTAANFVRAGAASQYKSVKHVSVVNLTSTASTADTITLTTGQSIDNVVIDLLNISLGTRILLLTQTTTTQQGIYEVTTVGSAPVLTRIRGMNSVAAAVTTPYVNTASAVPFTTSIGGWVQVIPGLWAGTALSCTRNFSAYINSVRIATVGTTVITMLNASGPNGYVPPAGARIRIPNIYCGVTKTTVNYNQTGYLGAGGRPSYNATATNRFKFVATRPTINISYATIMWQLAFTSASNFSITNSAFAGPLSLSEETVAATTFNTVGGGFAVNETSNPVSITAFIPISLTRNTGAVFTSCRFTAPSAITANSSVFNYTSNLTLNSCTFGGYAGNLTISFLHTVTNETLLTFLMCTNVTMSNLVCIGGRILMTNMLNVVINGLQYADRMVGTADAGNPLSLLVPTDVVGLFVQNYSPFGSLENLQPYSAFITAVRCNNITLADFGTPYRPILCCTLPGTGNMNTGLNNLISAATTDIIDGLTIRRVYFKNPRGSGAFLSGPSTNIQVRNVELTDFWWHAAGTSSLTPTIAYESAVVRGILSATIGVATATTVRDIIFANCFITSTTGQIAIMACVPYDLASYVTTTGSPSYGSNGSIWLCHVNDSVTWEWPYFILGYTGFSITAIALGVTGTNLSFTFDWNTGSGWSGSYTTLSTANLQSAMASLNPATGFKLRLRATCLTAGRLTTTNQVTYIRINMTTTATARLNTYTTAVDSTLAGRVTGYSFTNGRVKNMFTSTLTPSQPTTSAISSSWETGVDPITGSDTIARIKYSSTGAPLYPRIGDAHQV